MDNQKLLYCTLFYGCPSSLWEQNESYRRREDKLMYREEWEWDVWRTDDSLPTLSESKQMSRARRRATFISSVGRYGVDVVVVRLSCYWSTGPHNTWITLTGLAATFVCSVTIGNAQRDPWSTLLAPYLQLFGLPELRLNMRPKSFLLQAASSVKKGTLLWDVLRRLYKLLRPLHDVHYPATITFVNLTQHQFCCATTYCLVTWRAPLLLGHLTENHKWAGQTHTTAAL